MQNEVSDSVKAKILDVRPVFAQGDSPCGAIDEAVTSLRPGQNLVLLLPFEPKPLYKKLAEVGFSHRAEPLPDESWRVEFTMKEGAPVPQTLGSVACDCQPPEK
jgi:hypothetical protein